MHDSRGLYYSEWWNGNEWRERILIARFVHFAGTFLVHVTKTSVV